VSNFLGWVGGEVKKFEVQKIPVIMSKGSPPLDIRNASMKQLGPGVEERHIYTVMGHEPVFVGVCFFVLLN